MYTLIYVCVCVNIPVRVHKIHPEVGSEANERRLNILFGGNEMVDWYYFIYYLSIYFLPSSVSTHVEAPHVPQQREERMGLCCLSRCHFRQQRWESIKENKKVRKQEFGQESDQEKNICFSFFSWLLSWSSSCFLDRFLGRVLVLLFSYFLVFFYKFPPQNRILWFFFAFYILPMFL